MKFEMFKPKEKINNKETQTIVFEELKNNLNIEPQDINAISNGVYEFNFNNFKTQITCNPEEEEIIIRVFSLREDDDERHDKMIGAYENDCKFNTPEDVKNKLLNTINDLRKSFDPTFKEVN